MEVETELLNIILIYLHNVHKPKACRAESVCLPVGMFEIDNRWTDSNQICCDFFAARGQSILLFHIFLQSITTCRT
jgi:hypothetical protein